MRILLVEDDESVAKVLQKVLTEERYAVDVAHDGHIGWQMVSASPYDLVVLDVVLPKLDGLEFCRRLRQLSYNMPVLLVTALDSSTKKIAGLNAGADDYITKPFELEELLARVRALLRRVQTSVLLMLEWGELRLEVNSREVAYGENSLNLTPKEYALLELFLRNSSQVFSRRAILDNLWSYSDAPGEETVTSHMKGLRRKLTNAGAPTDFIETVYGVGYRLKPLANSACIVPPACDTASQAQAILEVAEGNSQVAELESVTQKAVKIRQQKTAAALTTLWSSVKFQQRKRLRLLKQVLQQLKTGSISETQRQSAYRVAHSLTGVLGIFGLTAGSNLAREVQEILYGCAPITRETQEQLIVLINALDKTLSQAMQESELLPKTLRTPLLVLIDPQLNLPPILAKSLREKGLTIKNSPHLGALEKMMAAQGIAKGGKHNSRLSDQDAFPDVIFLDFSLQDADARQMAQLSALVNKVPSLMVLICSADDALATRVKASQLGRYPFLYNPGVAEIVKGVETLRSHPQQANRKILVVDDDPQVLAGLQTCLEPQGFKIVTLGKPLQFWQTLQETVPDILLLDISMPEFSGIELCQAVRQAPFWNHLPIVFFTSHVDAHVQQAAFRAGADDLVEKSSPSSELIAHLYSQINRSRLQQAIAAMADGITSSSP